MKRSRLAGLGELMLPGAGVGAMAGVFAGLATLVVGLSPGLALVNALGLGIPMALFGGTYTILCAQGIARVGVYAPCALFWLVGYPVSRIVQETSAGVYLDGSLGLSTDLVAFYLYNALLAPGLAFGFIWLHERLAPPWLLRIRDHNRLAAGLAAAYLTYAQRVFEQKQRRAAMRAHKKQRAVGA
ncbi:MULTISPECIES: hypothetical protein [Nocardioides]|uniref:Uncharacterized protein n=1 Tax=Nocardioides vastitatis TaxID=2568655 RepID=A0ABW0ZCU0_9ACTN|nr:hypothetical protein [Nocardioides sp.]THI96950.1 hypothetical protein E7Z54_15750 [Nocardioides sp.]